MRQAWQMAGSPAKVQEEDYARGSGRDGDRGSGIAEEQIERGGRIARASCVPLSRPSVSFSATVWFSH